MDGVSVKELKEVLDRKESIGVCVGKGAGADEIAAALSFYLGLKSSGYDVSIASPMEPTVEVSSLVGINKIKQEFESANGPLVVSFPYREGEIEKISYTMEGGSLNIVVKPGELGLSFSDQDVTFKRTGDRVGTLIVVGTSRLSDLGKLFNPEELKDATVVNIDNKQDNQGFGDIIMLKKDASSVSEIIADILLSLASNIDLDIAQNILYGIVYATNNFQSPKTSSLAFEMAAVMIQKGAIRRDLSKREPTRDEFENLTRGFPAPPPPFPKPIRPASVQGGQVQGTQPGRAVPSPFPKPNQTQRNVPPLPSMRPQSQFEPLDDSFDTYDEPPMPLSPFPGQGQSQSPMPMTQRQPQSNPFQPQTQAQPQPQQPKRGEKRKERFQKNPPEDWLAPKVYKGSSDFQG